METKMKSLIQRMRVISDDHRKYEQGGGAAEVLDEAADAIEQLIAAAKPVLVRAEDWFSDLGGAPADDDEFSAMHKAIDEILMGMNMPDKMHTCGTCRFQGPEIEKYDEETFETKGTGYFPCQRIKHDARWKYQQGQRAIVVDGSGYHAALCVESDFGCRDWESEIS